MRVLIVEDNRIFRELLTAIVTASDPGARLEEAEDLASAEALLREQGPDVAFVDCRLPDGNGLDLIPTLQAVSPGGVIAVCTSYDLVEYRNEADRCGAQFFVPKDGFAAHHVYEALARGYRALGESPEEGADPALLRAMEQEDLGVP